MAKDICLKVIGVIVLANFLFLPTALGQHNPRPVLFKNGSFTGERNVLNGQLTKDSLSAVHYKKNFYVLVQFDKLPGASEREEMSGMGIRLFDYIPNNAFLAELPESFSPADLKKYTVSGIYSLPGRFKIAKELLENPDEYANSTDKLIAVSFFGTISKAAISEEIEQAGAKIIRTKIQPDHVVFINADGAILQKIAALPNISYMGAQPIKDLPLNYNNRGAHGVDALGAPSGRNLQGRRVTIGIGDNSDPYTHVDFTGRLIGRFAAPVSWHGTHTSGTVAGGGILDPRFKGMAPQATIVNQYFSDILVNTPTYVTDYNMVLTNNSYTAYNSGCAYEGEYDALSNFLDAQSAIYPQLLHNFAAGNDGQLSCAPYPAPFGTVKSGFQCAKNVLTVGNLNTYNYTINLNSSSGPVNDGRLKPEIVAGGTSVISTTPYNNYGSSSGTSMAAPTVTGTLALLYERYRQLHGGADPTAALIKAIACNSATDLGNPGPDFIYGFGMLSARTAVETIEGNQYFTGTLNNNGTATYTLSGVPAGAQQVKILLYWPDAPAAPFAATTLVNNLDLTVTSPDATLHHPMVLNPNPARVNDYAVEGVDNSNNIEQVVINNPPAGNFTITVNGTSIPGGSQNYVIAYQVIKPSVTVEYPFGNETWVPGQTEIIRWSAYGGDPNTFTIEYSADNGSSWTTISNSVPAASRSYPWTTPSTATNQALIRITRNGTGYSNISRYNFTVLGQPVITVTNPCEGYAQLSWGSIPSATAYDILQLKGDTMQVVANTTGTSYLLGNLSRDSSYWLAVRAVNTTAPGRRSRSAAISPAGGSCALPALDKDLTVNALVAPVTGRMFTSSQLNGSTPIQAGVKNLGTIATSGSYTLSYRVNGGSIVTESVSAVIAPNTAFNYTFTNTADFSSAGSYTLQVWVTYPGDPQSGNDTLTRVIKQLQNDPVVLNPNYTEGFESATVQTYTSFTRGLAGLDRCDFNASNSNGRMRPFINTGFARTGNRCATLDQAHYSTVSTADSLITTFNLSGYSGSDQLWLDFYYQNQGIDFSLPGNQVWIRGNENAAWIPVYTLDSSASGIGAGYLASPGIDITGILAGVTPSQSVSSSFQIKFGEQGYTSTNSVIPDGNLDDGYSFDDITISRAINDMAMLALLPPNLSGICNLSNAETIRVKVKNYSGSTANNIPVSYSINGSPVTEIIPSIKANDSAIYTFARKADLSAFQKYTMRAWVSYPGDNYHKNDTFPDINFQTTPLISTFPYLEGFENNDGHWYTNGINDSWQWGAPAKTIINKAAGGAKCWVTSLTGNYNNNELSYLYSPCFDLSGLFSPMLSFSHISRTEDNCDCDYHWVEYSTDGLNWTKLGKADSSGNGTNWYDNATRQAWQLSYTKWHVSSYAIPTNGPKVRFRIVMNSDPATTYEGVGIDDVHIFDNVPIYNRADISSGLVQPVSGNNWVDFDRGAGRVVSINPNGQDLGNTSVGVYINRGSVRNDGYQYYLDRNIVIQPANPPTGNVSVRYYFLGTEVDSLLRASGCSTCTTIPDAYQAGIMQYSSPVLSEEDNVLNNNINGTFHFLLPRRDLSIIPYDKGYYAEYQVSGFSEFWINGGTPGQNQPYPLALLSFTAARSGSGALLQWSTTQEKSTSRFVIQKSSDNVNFFSIDSVKAIGDSNAVTHYRFIDNHLLNGVTYYRLKMIGLDGRFKYSPIRSLNNTINNLVISLYPNPVQTGILYISTSVNCQSIQIFDVSGRVIKTVSTHGFLNMLYLGDIAKGIYFVSLQTDAGRRVQKILIK